MTGGTTFEDVTEMCDKETMSDEECVRAFWEYLGNL